MMNMELMLTPEAGLTGLFLLSFLASTLLPGGSEAALLALLALHPELKWQAFALATLGNTLGSLSSYGLAWLVPDKALAKLPQQRMAQVKHWGAPVLVLAWLPLIGDVLCVAAGCLRLPLIPCSIWIALGKGLRYLALLEGWQWLFG